MGGLRQVHAYCTSLYTTQIWWNFHKNRLNVAYNDVIRMLLRIPRYYSASQMFSNIQVPTCLAVIQNTTLKFISRLKKSRNAIIKGLIDPLVSDTRFTPVIWRHWFKQLYIHFFNG